MELLAVSDTHVPSRARSIPDWVRDRIDRADHLIHAGDFDSEEAYDRIRSLADGEMTAVEGNTDPSSLSLPTVDTLQVGSVRTVVAHGHRHDEADLIRTAHDENAEVCVTGHSHRLRNEVIDGVRLVNPGSATGAAPAHRASVATLRIDEGAVSVDMTRR